MELCRSYATLIYQYILCLYISIYQYISVYTLSLYQYISVYISIYSVSISVYISIYSVSISSSLHSVSHLYVYYLHCALRLATSLSVHVFIHPNTCPYEFEVFELFYYCPCA
jgi:hypothetical protein